MYREAIDRSADRCKLLQPLNKMTVGNISKSRIRIEHCGKCWNLVAR